MAKYYVTYKNLRLVRDAESPAKAAALVLRQQTEQLKKNDTVYVDERGHRTRHAQLKYRVDSVRRNGERLWTLAVKKPEGN